MQYINRKDFIKKAGMAALGLATVPAIVGTMFSCTKTVAVEKTENKVSESVGSLPWPYVKLDPIASAERAYSAYYNGGCMYGAFEGIIGELNEKVGAPYTTFPSAMMKYGAAGVQGWGTLCGALNGISAVIFLVTDAAKVGGPLISEVFGWYGVTELPDYKPAKPKFPDIQKSISNSQLCHISVTKWCNKAGYKATSPERAERCAWLTASVARYTVDLLNKQYDNTFQKTFALPASVTGCLSCHGEGGAFENVHASKQLDCTECHTDLETEHPPIFK